MDNTYTKLYLYYPSANSTSSGASYYLIMIYKFPFRAKYLVINQITFKLQKNVFAFELHTIKPKLIANLWKTSNLGTPSGC